MNVEDLLEQIICDRIEMLLNECLAEDGQVGHKIKDIMEETFDCLDQELKTAMEQFWDEWIALSAEENRYLYLAGIKDGAKIFKNILGM